MKAGNDEEALAAMESLADVPRGENTELNLQLDIVLGRLALRADPSEANVAALESLIQAGEAIGYLRVANQARRDAASELAK